MTSTKDHLAMAIDLARQNVLERGARPFAAILVKDGAVVATGVNDVLGTSDPLKHAELEAIRAAALELKTPHLDGCIMYASGHPCAMCLSAIHMVGIKEVYYAYSRDAAEQYGFSTARIYAEMAKPLSQQSIKLEHVPLRDGGEDPYEIWERASRIR